MYKIIRIDTDYKSYILNIVIVFILCAKLSLEDISILEDRDMIA